MQRTQSIMHNANGESNMLHMCVVRLGKVVVISYVFVCGRIA